MGFGKFLVLVMMRSGFSGKVRAMEGEGCALLGDEREAEICQCES